MGDVFAGDVMVVVGIVVLGSVAGCEDGGDGEGNMEEPGFVNIYFVGE